MSLQERWVHLSLSFTTFSVFEIYPQLHLLPFPKPSVTHPGLHAEMIVEISLLSHLIIIKMNLLPFCRPISFLSFLYQTLENIFSNQRSEFCHTTSGWTRVKGFNLAHSFHTALCCCLSNRNPYVPVALIKATL